VVIARSPGLRIADEAGDDDRAGVRSNAVGLESRAGMPFAGCAVRGATAPRRA
jgi:hypothetical protein